VNASFLLQSLESRAGKVAIPSDVRALFESVDADSKLREAFDEIDVSFDIDDRTQANHQDVVLLFANRHDESFAALETSSGALIRVASDQTRKPCDSMATLVGDILVDVIDHADTEKEEPAYVVMTAMEHANLPLSHKVKKAFKSLTR
jgi:hypothetical protein